MSNLPKTYRVKKFRKIIYDFYRENARRFPWRETQNPYRIFISEAMLQQTRTSTVVPKYQAFLKAFPDFRALATASLSEILHLWQGLGYNRRAVSLKRAAQIIIEQWDGILPNNMELLDSLPGIGTATASAICAFAFNAPTVFIETNIRRVFLHFFFSNSASVDDKKLFPLIKKYLDKDSPRHWYYALMDYGAMLKTTQKNPNRRSAHYAVQSKFEGSDRQIRGMILRLLLKFPRMERGEIYTHIQKPTDRTARMLTALKKEGFIKVENRKLFIC